TSPPDRCAPFQSDAIPRVLDPCARRSCPSTIDSAHVLPGRGRNGRWRWTRRGTVNPACRSSLVGSSGVGGRMERTTDSTQGLLVFSRRGGKRKGAGRKPKGPRAGVPHERREDFPSSAPIHVTVTVCKGVPNLRSRKAVRVVKTCI